MNTTNDELERMLGRELHDQVDRMDDHPLGLGDVKGRACRIQRNRRLAAGAVVAAAVPRSSTPVAMFAAQGMKRRRPGPRPGRPAAGRDGQHHADPRGPGARRRAARSSTSPRTASCCPVRGFSRWTRATRRWCRTGTSTAGRRSAPAGDEVILPHRGLRGRWPDQHQQRLRVEPRPQPGGLDGGRWRRRPACSCTPPSTATRRCGGSPSSRSWTRSTSPARTACSSRRPPRPATHEIGLANADGSTTDVPGYVKAISAQSGHRPDRGADEVEEGRQRLLRRGRPGGQPDRAGLGDLRLLAGGVQPRRAARARQHAVPLRPGRDLARDPRCGDRCRRHPLHPGDGHRDRPAGGGMGVRGQRGRRRPGGRREHGAAAHAGRDDRDGDRDGRGGRPVLRHGLLPRDPTGAVSTEQSPEDRQARTEVTGSDESAGRSSGDGVRPRATIWAPRAATIAPLSVHRPGRGTRTRIPWAVAPLLGHGPQPRVRRHATADQQVVDAVRRPRRRPPCGSVRRRPPPGSWPPRPRPAPAHPTARAPRPSARRRS